MKNHAQQPKYAPGRNIPPVKRAKVKFQSSGHYTDKDRENIPLADFGDPDQRKYPIVIPADVEDSGTLIGHAHDPEAVKKRIIAIAKRKGAAFVAKIPDAWKEEGRVATAPVTRSSDALVRMAVPNAIRVVDEERREIEVCATSEALDTYKTRFAYDASKDAFQRWEGNVREMHAPVAVGRKVDIRFDDENRKVYTRLRISRGAEDTWQKVLDGTLSGASIGASNVEWREDRSASTPTKWATRYDLVELSLVDNASNPDAKGINIIRMSTPTEVVESDPTVAVAPLTSETRQVAQATNQIALSPGVPAPEQTLDTAQQIAIAALKRGQEEVRAQLATVQRDAMPAPMEHGASDDHVHDHDHTHTDGTKHSHPHAHSHDEHVARSAGASHAEHEHVTIRGQVYDAALITIATDTRAIPKSQSGSNVFNEAKPANPITTVQPRQSGSRVLVNTADPEASDFGVPDPAEARPTPEEAPPLSEGQFHPGGHQQEADWTEGTYDNDGDHDDEDNMQDKPIIASRPPQGSKIPLKSRTTPADDDQKGRATQADVTRAVAQFQELAQITEELCLAVGNVNRIGARLSADSMGAVHGIRDNALGVAHMAADHCGCDECMAHKTIIINLLEPEEGEGEEEEEGEDEGDEMMRQQMAEITRAVAELSKQTVAVTKNLSQRIADIDASMKDVQRTAQAEFTRSSDATLTALTEALKSAIAPLTEQLNAVNEKVERIEQQPAPTQGPYGAGAVEKRLALGTQTREDAIEAIAKSGDPRKQLDAFSILLREQQSR